jgi:hypothetical protein
MDNIIQLLTKAIASLVDMLGIPGTASIAAFVLIVILIALFNPQLREAFPNLFDRVDEIRFGSVAVKFRAQLKEAKHQLQRNPELTQTAQTASTRAADSIPPDLPSRDLVLESWGGLKQVIYDSLAAQNLKLTPATQFPDAVDRLVKAKFISFAQADHIKRLYQLGKRIADSAAILRKGDAVDYRELVYSMVDWLMVNFLPRKEVKPSPAPLRKTEVGGSFPPPSSTHASAILRGTSGALAGREFPVRREVFSIGASSDNDVVIPDDKYVSRSHAVVRYDSGGFWLVDQGSRNGTFLNDTRLKEAPMMISPGDRIRIGNAAFELIAASG